MQSQADDMFGYFRALADVKTMSDAIELQSWQSRKALDASLRQFKDLSALMNDMMVNAIGATLIVGLVHLRLTRKRGRRWAKTLAQHFVAQPPHSHPHRRGRKGAE